MSGLGNLDNPTSQHATGARDFAFNGCNNGAISHIVMTAEGIVVRGFNDSAHLVG